MVLASMPTRDTWLTELKTSLAAHGFAVLEGALDAEALRSCRERMYSVRERIVKDVGTDRLERAGEHGVLRLMMRYDPFFVQLLALPKLVSIVDEILSPTAIMHLQNGFILPPSPEQSAVAAFQYRFHQDFPRYMNGYVASLNVMVAVDEFTRENGATLVVPGTHQRSDPPALDAMARDALPIECPAGSLIVFDSTLWHAAGQNRSRRDRLAINHQFTRSFIKQQLDYPRALGEQIVASAAPRTQQMLGWYTRVPTSLAEYYVPDAERLYRGKQG